MKSRLLLVLCIMSSSIVYGAAKTTVREFTACCNICSGQLKFPIRISETLFLDKLGLFRHLASKGHKNLYVCPENYEKHFTFFKDDQPISYQDIEAALKYEKELFSIKKDVKTLGAEVCRLEQQQQARQARRFRPY